MHEINEVIYAVICREMSIWCDYTYTQYQIFGINGFSRKKTIKISC